MDFRIVLPSSEHATAVEPDISNPPDSEQLFDSPPYGLLTVDNLNDWKPSKISSQPPSCMPVGTSNLLVDHCLLHNASEYAKVKERRAVLLISGAVLLLPCRADQWPSDPAAFPPGTRLAPQSLVLQFAAEENGPRFELAKIPRRWTLALRPLVKLPESALTPKGGNRAD
ncbi:MAG: hypothetical protein KF777_01020 [Planctomycetaceae bacterium]|nr:hypothetical protein [Planctomycetaceae bacterium]